MTNNTTGYIEDTSDEHSMSCCSEQVGYSTKLKVVRNLPYKLKCVYGVENEKIK